MQVFKREKKERGWKWGEEMGRKEKERGRERGEVGRERGGGKERRGEGRRAVSSIRIYCREIIGYFKSSRVGRSPCENS